MELRLQTSYRQILYLALPISMALFVPQINFIINNVFLGRIGQQELASAGITGVYYLMFAVIGSGFNNGLQALIARRAGQNLPQEIGKLFYHGVWLALGFAAAGIVLTYALAPTILRWAIHDAGIAEQVIGFLRIRIWGLPFLYLYVMRNALLVGTNQTGFLVFGTLSEAIVNIVLDYALIFGHWGFPAVGFNGAAYASIIAEFTGLAVIYLIIHAKKLHVTFSFYDQKTLDTSIVRLILIQSSPLIAQYGISIMSWEYFYVLIEHHGQRALAISNTLRNIFGLFGVFAWAFASATNTMVSNIIGQGKEDQVIPLIRKIVRVSFSISFLIFIALVFKPEWFLSVYAQGPDFIADAKPVVYVVSVALLMMSFSTIWLNAVTGTGNTKVNLMIELITIVIYCVYVYVVLEYLNLPITWGWASELVYWTCMFSMAFWYMRSGRWKNKVI